MFARHNRLMGSFFIVVDALLAVASFHLAVAIRAHLHEARAFYPLSHYPWFIPLAVLLWVGVGVAAGIYREVREEDLRRAFGDPLKIGIASTIILFALTFALQLEYVSRLALGIFALIDLLLMTVFRVVAWRFAVPLRRSVAGFRHILRTSRGLFETGQR